MQSGWENTATTDHLSEAKTSKDWSTSGRATAELSLETTKDKPDPVLPVQGRNCISTGLEISEPSTALVSFPPVHSAILKHYREICDRI